MRHENMHHLVNTCASYVVTLQGETSHEEPFSTESSVKVVLSAVTNQSQHAIFSTNREQIKTNHELA